MSSCGQKETTTVNIATKTTFSTEPTGSFRIKKQVIKKGDTVWAISKDTYGTGLKWRDIVSQNPFLQQPGRVYFDTSLGEWIVIIRPGEELKIGGEVVSPVFVVEENTTTTTVTDSAPMIPWWGWLSIIAAAALIVSLFYNRSNNATAIAIANAGTHVDLRGTDNFDAATERAMRTRMIEREMYLKEDIWEDSRHILRSSADNNRLQNFTVSNNEDGIFVNANFRRDRRERNDRTQGEGK